MSRRSAPFVTPNTILINKTNKDPNINLKDSSNQNNKKVARELLSSLQADISAFRDDQFPPEILSQIRDMPIYQGNMNEVKSYHQRWQPLIDKAMQFYPSAYLPPDYLPLPASLEIPQFIYRVQRLHLTKTRAKESKSFGSVGALISKCGDFCESDIDKLEHILTNEDTARLVAHREFVDLRAYVFCLDEKGKLKEPERVRFYRTGLIVHAMEGFKVVDSRQKPRKRRNDAYTNPLADNGVWKVYKKR